MRLTGHPDAETSKMGQCTTLMTLLLIDFISSSVVPPRRYYYVNQALNWSDAQQYCRDKYTDLATFESMDDLNRLKADFSYTWAWIGLHDDPAAWKTSMGNASNSWRWSATGQTSTTGFQSWDSNCPDYYKGEELCVTIGGSGLWNDVNCNTFYPFLCFYDTDHNKKNYVLITQAMPWSSAQQYCMNNYTDLAMIENQQEHTEALNAKSSTSKVWIGLYREPWTWSDGSLSSFMNWSPTGLNNVNGNQHCVTENTQHQWDDEFCDIKWVFVCHQVLKIERKATLRLKFNSDADMTNPKVKGQILEQLQSLLSSDGRTDIKLQWKIEPKK